MLTRFILNNYIWKIKVVSANSPYLIDRLGSMTVATTDPDELCIFLSEELSGDFKKRVIAHEMGHAFCFSFGLLQEIWDCCYPDRRIQMEEFICNFVADYGERIFEITYKIMGDEALVRLPQYLERLVA